MLQGLGEWSQPLCKLWCTARWTTMHKLYKNKQGVINSSKLKPAGHEPDYWYYYVLGFYPLNLVYAWSLFSLGCTMKGIFIPLQMSDTPSKYTKGTLLPRAGAWVSPSHWWSHKMGPPQAKLPRTLRAVGGSLPGAELINSHLYL